MGPNTRTLSPLDRHSLSVIRQRIEMIDQIRSGFIVVLRVANDAIREDHADLLDALHALEQAMETPMCEIREELKAMLPEGAA
jgi:hypothetical protein